MKKSIVIGFVVLTWGLLATTARAHGIGGLGGFHGGGHGGMGGFRGSFGGSHGGFGHPGFHGSFGHPGFHGSFGRPGFQRFGHFNHFQHEQFFGPHHHFEPFVPFGHGQHFRHEFFLGPHHHFGSFPGGSFFGRSFFPVSPRAVVISTPFFCFPDGLGFTDQALFFDHLHQIHGIPPDRALPFSTPLLGGRRFIFFGF